MSLGKELLSKSVCPACGSHRLTRILPDFDLPTQSCTLWPSRDAAVSGPRGVMSLALCEECGLLVNAAFDASRIDYDEDYENSLHFSKMFGEYAQWLARSEERRVGHACRSRWSPDPAKKTQSSQSQPLP